MRALALSTLLLAACTGGDGADADADGETDGPADGGDRFSELINVEVEATGDHACFTPGTDHASTTWLTQALDATKQADYPVTGLVEDFESGDSVDAATVELWFDDVVDGAP